MSFSESIDLTVNATAAAAASELRDVGEAADEAKQKVDELDGANADVDVDAAGLPSVRAALEDVRDAADQLDAESVSVDVDVDTSGATGNLDNLRNTGDRTRSVMANLAGNATQDLGALGGVAGTAGVAIGQMAEYATEGGIALRGMVLGGAGIAGAAAALEYMSGTMKAIADADAFETEQIDAFKEALLEGKDAVTALHDALIEAGGVTVREFGEAGLAGGLPWGDKTVIRDVTEEVNNAGLKVKEFTEIASGGKPAIDAWAQSQIDAGTATDDLQVVVQALYQKHAQLTAAQKSAETTQKFLSTAVKDAAPIASAATVAVLGLASAYRSLAASANAAREAQKAALAAGQELEAAGGGGGGGGTRVMVQNFHPPAVSPGAVNQAQVEYRRINEGPS